MILKFDKKAERFLLSRYRTICSVMEQPVALWHNAATGLGLKSVMALESGYKKSTDSLSYRCDDYSY